MYCSELGCANLAPCKTHRVGVEVRAEFCQITDGESATWELHFAILSRQLVAKYVDYNPGRFTYKRWMDFTDGKVDLRFHSYAATCEMAHLRGGTVRFASCGMDGPTTSFIAHLHEIAAPLRGALEAARAAAMPFSPE